MLEVVCLPHAERIPLEAECLSPDTLRSLTLAEIERLMVYHGNRREPLAEHFRVSGDPSDGAVRLLGDAAQVKWIGAKMTGGHVVVEQDAGMHLGSEMAGGSIEVHGHAGDWVGAEMTGGTIVVRGNAGHLVGGAYRGSKVGMRGGVIVIGGHAGNEIGNHLRRGWITIGGNCGDFAGVGMIAGTILVFGTPGIRAGAGMKRGTIAFLGATGPGTLLPSFGYACDYAPGFLAPYLLHLSNMDALPHTEALRVPVCARYSGDLLELGKGEILVRRAA